MPDSFERWGGNTHRSRKQTWGIAIAAILGVVALGLVVLGNTQKQVQIGLIVGGWAVVVGLISVFWRHHGDDSGEPPTSDVRDLELRRGRELERERVASERRAYIEQLEQLMRRQVREALREEVGALRDEVSALRSDLVEKVNGQLKLERVETTRLIGSDLEALQHEVRRLAVARTELAAPAVRGMPTLTETTVLPRVVAPVSTMAPADADVVFLPEPVERVEPPSAGGDERSSTTPVVSKLPTPPTPSPAARVDPPVDHPPPAARVDASVDYLSVASRPTEDPFAGLPRLGGFADLPDDASTGSGIAALRPVEVSAPFDADAGYVGRRRRAAEAAERERSSGATDRIDRGDSAVAGRRRAGDGADDVLARLLGR